MNWIDALIPQIILAGDAEVRRRGRLVVYAIGLAVLATLLAGLVLLQIGHDDTGVFVASTAGAYFLVWVLLWITGSTRLCGHLFLFMVMVALVYDYGPDSGYGVLAGIAMPIAAAALLGVKEAVVWMIISIAWQSYFGPVIFRPGEFSLRLGLGSGLMTLIIGIAATIMESTREGALQEAQAQRRRLQELSERMLVFAERTFPAIVQAQDNRITKINHGVESLLGYPPDVVTAENLLSYVHPDDLARWFSQVRGNSNSEFRSELRVRHGNGHWNWIEIYSLPHAAFDGEPEWIFAARDINDEVQSRERLLQAQRLESVGTLAAGLAHDLNNLLTVVIGSAELLEPSEDQQQIVDAAQRAADMVTALRTFGQTQQASDSRADAIAVIQSSQAIFDGMLSPSISFKMEVQGDEAIVGLDTSQINQVLLNLITNAREAIEDSGQVLLEAIVDDQVLTIKVEDTGRGMSEQTRSRVFEPFYSTKPKHQNSGLGLASTFGIVNRAGGAIEVHSTIGQGTHVQVTLPLLSAANQPTAQAEAKQLEVAGLDCVLVEDNEAVRDVLVKMLQDLELEVRDVADADAGLKLIREKTPSVLVTDVVMQGMQGTEMVKIIRREHPQLPIIVVSGYDQTGQAQWLEDKRVVFLAKPISQEDLTRTLGKLLG